jgi:Transposase DDE domain
MPYKFNEPRRHKIPRARYRVQNWPEYDRALQQRGSLAVWVTPEAIAAWCPPRTGRRGRPRDYSEVAIETGHLLRLAFGRPWRQTEGLLRSVAALVAALLGLDLGIPDHTTFSRRSPGLVLAKSLAQAQAGGGPVHVVIDATGLKVFGAGEWSAEKHGERGKRTWRKLHLAVDPDSGEILACELATNEESDASQVGPLLEQISGPLGSVTLGSVTADGAYDGEPVYRAVAERQPDPPVDVVIPPRSTAAASAGADAAPTQRDRHIQLIRDRGRLGWQKATGYGRRSLGETAMSRYKTLLGRGLRARTLSAQKTEARVGCAALNRVTRLGMPVSRRIA